MKKRIRYTFDGTVQGVGFRPFVFRVASGLGLTGFVQNTPAGVVAEVEGPPDKAEGFLAHIRGSLPPLAVLHDVRAREVDPLDDTAFSIRHSLASGVPDVPIPPDTATCEACRGELFDPADRRFRYPFINCTDCGPRLTIVSRIPYDRPNTSMAGFALCADCRREYEDPRDRRFHAEPNACPVCGPRLELRDAGGRAVETADPLAEAVEALARGKIVAVKSLGGFHLCADAASDAALKTLRLRKFREEKPFAIMAAGIETARRLACTCPDEEELLCSPQRPIVLVRRKNDAEISCEVAPGMPRLGIMLPATPLHHLLLEHFSALVMTSANKKDEPICIDNREAVERLRGTADLFLMHDRDILVRCDDSIAVFAGNAPRILRRARGFVPAAVRLDSEYPEVIALGPHLKSTVCIVRGRHAYLSSHIGDMETPLARDFLHESIERLQHITACSPRAAACDLHPGYYATRAAGENATRVQHHHAHIVSCMAENRAAGPVIGLAMDGTGFGPDGCIWGGEFLIAGYTGCRRAGHIRYFPLPGGEQAVREPWRIAASLLKHAFGNSWQGYAERLRLADRDEMLQHIDMMIERGINCPQTSSLGRLFDGMASLLGIRSHVGFEGQAAMELEGRAAAARGPVLPYSIQESDGLLLDTGPLVRDIVEKRCAGADIACLAASFHATLCDAFAEAAERLRSLHSISRVALSGGCFQNVVLLEGCINALEQRGFEVLTHRLVPANDGGIALGQAVIAAAQLRDGEDVDLPPLEKDAAHHGG